jgi:hypothetical protein
LWDVESSRLSAEDWRFAGADADAQWKKRRRCSSRALLYRARITKGFERADWSEQGWMKEIRVIDPTRTKIDSKMWSHVPFHNGCHAGTVLRQNHLRKIHQPHVLARPLGAFI